jgi:hypothetical protein
MNRVVEPEILDALPPADPRALGSRRDLRRINFLMRNHVLMADALLKSWPDAPPRRLTEIGAGDGQFLLSVAKRISQRWPNLRATLLDRQPSVTRATLADFVRLGWRTEAVATDVFDWPRTFETGTAVIANLFLHHFEGAQLEELLRLIAGRADLFIAIEPRRAPGPLFLARCLWALGCNDVTRHDAVVSVRAGFTGGELSALWPDRQNWKFTERGIGLASHLFIARKIN